MTAIDGGSGETENTAVLVVHLKYAGATIDIPMRRGQGGFWRPSILTASEMDGRLGRSRGRALER
jgi:hypothetical protein